MKINLKSEKGITGINIATAIIILFIFISIIAVIFYNTNSASKELELKSKATVYAVEEIEKLKASGFENLPTENIKQEEIQDEKGNSTSFYKTIIIEDYANTDAGLEIGAEAGIVKKITVRIEYMFKAQTQTVELSTIITKEN